MNILIAAVVMWTYTMVIPADVSKNQDVSVNGATFKSYAECTADRDTTIRLAQTKSIRIYVSECRVESFESKGGAGA